MSRGLVGSFVDADKPVFGIGLHPRVQGQGCGRYVTQAVLEEADAGRRGQYPAYLACRTAADLLEGAGPEGTSNLGAGVSACRFRQPTGGKAIVLWGPKDRVVRVPDVSEAWKAYDMLGRPVAWLPGDELQLSIFPVYVTTGRIDGPSQCQRPRRQSSEARSRLSDGRHT